MGGPRCDFYDWVTHTTCDDTARWVTHQKSQDTGRLERYYCDRHRPPRAHLIARPGAAQDPKAR
jgi:hypothetical protein